MPRPLHLIDTITCHVAGHWAFVEVTTDQGLTGIGEATYFTHPTAVAAIVPDLLPAYRGQDAFRPEYLFNRVIKKHCLRDAAAMAALSAIDQALWDIKGKALGVPVWQLLGGKVRDRVRAILLVEGPSRDDLVAKAVAARDEGFTALKIKPFLEGWGRLGHARALRDVVANVAAVREAIGWDIDLAVEVHRNLTPDQAVTFADAVRPLMLYFIEDAILPYSIDANNHMSAAMRSPSATAERQTNIFEFRETSDAHAVSILRPDIGLAGGFTQLRKIAAIAESRHQRIVPHNFTAPVSTAGHIQLAACTVNWDVQGYVREDRAPWTDVVDRINTLKDGFLEIPDRPGIGMALNREYLAGARYVPFGDSVGHTATLGMDGGVRLL
ncbi:mandelate racemase/muconate lactonizing enzyme family protein [Niveispirillum sp.]|uniref:mandelate racemase/muconate lactonizing enzyme family protein n=1 Tax=Niveispirillum sp. TaxID=1917217 RepID=UPI001B6A5FF7|nr:mandelate racemase/muconate lactonizing enzyme family protein [Niveispirillum sp.]MBP7336702.1 mandelate racemase/muconate lactonizing enzyme family protein [Niveispirillum sp.]